MSEMTQADVRGFLDAVSEWKGEWQCIPVPVPGMRLRLCEGHPMAGLFAETDAADPVLEILVGGPTTDGTEVQVNQWYSRKRNATVYVYHHEGKAFAATRARSPDQSMDRLFYWLTTLGASDAWDEDAEHRARDTLRAMLSERQWRHYDLTGSFLETSPRSQVTYLFRRLRPTLALSPRQRPGSMGDDEMLCIACLCAHPLGFYERSWGGCMVPTDDVIAALSWMRGDEARWWGVCNIHEAWTPEAGL